MNEIVRPPETETNIVIDVPNAELDVAEYIRDMTRQLTRLCYTQRLTPTAKYLDLAAQEAERLIYGITTD